MNIKLVRDHTIVDMPSDSNKVLDVGCQLFDFAVDMAAEGYQVHCLEPDMSVSCPRHPNLFLHNFALVPEQQSGLIVKLIKCYDNQANHLSSIPGSKGPTQEVSGISLLQFSKLIKIPVWDIIKMNCEGAEYFTLLEWPGPIAKQITVSFHEHIGAGIDFYGSDIYNRIIKHLSQWYEVVQHELSQRHGIKTLNYWDSLFVLKGIH